MRLKTIALLLLLPVASAFAAPASRTAVLEVQNMTCSMCTVTIKKAFQKLPGVEDAAVDFEHKTATVKYDPAKVDAAALIKATTDAGFPATERK